MILSGFVVDSFPNIPKQDTKINVESIIFICGSYWTFLVV